MTELENTTITPRINDNIITFYSRFVDDTLRVVKAGHLSYSQPFKTTVYCRYFEGRNIALSSSGNIK